MDSTGISEVTGGNFKPPYKTLLIPMNPTGNPGGSHINSVGNINQNTVYWMICKRNEGGNGNRDEYGI